MKNILSFAGSNSSASINFKLVQYMAPLITEHKVTVLDIHKWVIPTYSEDMDADDFTPDEITKLIKLLAEYDAFVISVAEHNESTTAFFKNITDWLSRQGENVMGDKPTLLLSTSSGRRAAALSREYSMRTLPRISAKVVAEYGLPSFKYTMVEGKLVVEEQANLDKVIRKFQDALK